MSSTFSLLSNAYGDSARRLESFIAWEDEHTNQQHVLISKYPDTADCDVVVIEIEKNCPTIGKHMHDVIHCQVTMVTLGLSVDGGVDTNQKEIRVTAVKPGGAAHCHGFLKVISCHFDHLLIFLWQQAGFEILEVDGEVIRGMKHRDACLAIHKAFKSKKSKLEMIVIPCHVHNTP